MTAFEDLPVHVWVSRDPKGGRESRSIGAARTISMAMETARAMRRVMANKPAGLRPSVLVCIPGGQRLGGPPSLRGHMRKVKQ